MIGATGSCRRSERAEAVRPAPALGTNVLLITLDTLRADHLPPYGYAALETPAISRLATEGVRFASAYAPVPLTLPSHASLLTGLLPTKHGVRDNGGFHLGANHPTLPEAFKRAGYATAAFVSAFVLDSRWGLDRGFDRYFDDFTVSAGDLGAMASIQRPAGATWAEARTWLDGHHAERFFAWVHFFDPHTPYAPPAPFQSKYTSRPYDGEIAYVDSVLAQIVDYLESRLLLDKTVIIVAADHGEGLGDHDEDEHGLLAYDSTLRVPWIVRLPNRQSAGRVVSEPVSLVDMFPTVASLVGIDVPAQVDGVDRMPLITGGHVSDGALYAETFYPRLRMGWSELTTIRYGEYKYIKAPEPELYNYRTDPGETSNLATREPETVTKLDRILSGALAQGVGATAPRPNTPDPQTVRQLQALGYVAGAATPLDTTKGLADPKTKTAAYRALTRARQQLSEGKHAAGLQTLQALVLAEPGIEVARRTLREYWIANRRFDEAKRWLRSAAARGGEAGLWRDLAIVARAARDPVTAREAIERALVIHPDNADSLIVAGEIQRDRGEFDAALASFRRAAERAADPAAPQMQAAQTLIAMGRLAEAESTARLVLAKAPHAANVHYMLAQIAEARKDFRAAEAEYRLEIARHPWEYRARFNLALLLGARGARAEQLTLLQSIPPLAPEFHEIHFYIAKALLDSGDASRLAEAAQAAHRGLQLAPSVPTAPLGHYVLADIYRLTHRPADAAREIQRGRELEQRLAQQAR